MIRLSPSAIAEINRIRSKHPNPDTCFRLGVKSGGCADLYYTMELDEAIDGADQIVDCEGIRVAIDSESWPYLNGLTIDYTEDLMGGGFRFNNPNATSNCGCGNSFSVNPA